MDHSKTYQRLLEINFEIDPKPIPDPQYINSKIGELHRLIGEIEKFAIEANQELSAYQKALNDAEALYENAKENLLITDTVVKDLPSIKDREAKVNSMLKKEVQAIREYQNQVSACTNLLRAINLKQKNMNRANADIKMQLRMMEAQIKLGTPMIGDSATRSLMRELASGISSDETFGEVETTVKASQIVDPTTPVDVSSVLREAPSEIVGPDADGEDEEQEGFGLEDPTEALLSEPSEEASQEADTPCQEIDLDEAIDGTAPAAPTTNPNTEKVEQETATDTQKGGVTPQDAQSTDVPAPSIKAGQSGGIDLDSLLSQFN